MSLIRFIGSKFASLRNRIDDRLMERRLNIQTSGRQAVDVADSVAYSTFAYAGIFRVLDRLELRPDDVFADLGCGKGRVVCCAAMKSVRKAVGIDLDPNLCQLARRNAEQMRHRRSTVDIVNLPAQQFDYRECTALFLFNPFGFSTMSAAVDAVVGSLRDNPRAVRLAYVNPRHDKAIADAGAFEQYDQWRCRSSSRLKFDVSFWRSIRT